MVVASVATEFPGFCASTVLHLNTIFFILSSPKLASGAG